MNKYKVTARWIGVSITNAEHYDDIVELNGKYYLFVGSYLSNSEIEKDNFDMPDGIEESTINLLETYGDYYGILPILKNRKPDWTPICECGSDSIYGPNNSIHSSWCPKCRI